MEVMIFSHIIYGLLAITGGTLLLKYNFKLVNTVGRLDFIESKLGSGSTFLVYKLLAMALIAGGLLYATGLSGPLLAPLARALRSIFPGTGGG